MREFFVHLYKAFFYSLQGLRVGWQGVAMRQEMLVFIPLFASLLLFGKSAWEWFFCLSLWALVIVVELLNTAIEKTLDRISTEYSPLTKDAKDLGSAAAFTAILINIGVWIFMFGPDILALFGIEVPDTVPHISIIIK